MGRAWVRGIVVAASIAACGGDGREAGSLGAGSSSTTGGDGSDTTGEADGTASGTTHGNTEPSSSSGADTSAGSGTDSGDVVEAPSCDALPAFLAAFKASHPDGWDINAMTPAEIAADADAQALLSLCGDDQRPVIPQLAWEYGGGDHPWIAPEASALFYCVSTPVDPGTEHWSFDAAMQLVTADVVIGCPQQNPCDGMAGADAVLMCLGDSSNIEIVVDTASLDDGHGAGLELAEASTDLYLLQEDGTRVLLWHDA